MEEEEALDKLMHEILSISLRLQCPTAHEYQAVKYPFRA